MMLIDHRVERQHLVGHALCARSSSQRFKSSDSAKQPQGKGSGEGDHSKILFRRAS